MMLSRRAPWLGLPIALLLSLAFLPAARAQDDANRVETLQLRDGRLLTGRVEVRDDDVVLTQSVGGGEANHVLAHDRLEPSSLYGLMSSHLAPHDEKDEVRLGELALEAGLFATAARHFRDSATDPKHISDELFARIDGAEKRDFASLIERSEAALKREDFRRARQIALLAVKRYADRPEIAAAEKQLETISRRMEDASRRRETLARSKRELAEWQKAEKKVLIVADQLDEARADERRALAGTEHFSRARDRFEFALRHLDSAARSAEKLREDQDLPRDLRDELAVLEDAIVTMQIRLRLHVASLYTVRGSYSSAVAYVNQALAFDPTDEGALAARARIEQAAAAASASRVINR